MHLLTRALFLLTISFLLFSNVAQGQSVNLMFYFQSDNPQACQAAKAIGDIVSAYTTSSPATATIFWQRSSTYCASNTVGGIPAYSGSRIFRVAAGSLTQLADLGTVDATSPSTFTSFVSTAMSGLPSTITSHVLVFSGPASYFYFGTQESQSSPQNAGWLYPSLAAAVASAASLTSTGRFDYVYFDAAYTASVETAQAFSDAGGVTYLLGYQSIQQPINNYGVLLNLGSTDAPTFLTAVYNSIMSTSGGFASSYASVSAIQLSMVSPITTAVDTLARGLRLFPQRVFAELRRNQIEVDLSPYPVTARSVVDLGYLGRWLSTNRENPFNQPMNSNLAGAIVSAVSAAVVFHSESTALGGATGINIWFPLTNTTQSFLDTTNLYATAYGNNFGDWYGFLLQYLFAIHNNFLFENPSITYNNPGYTLSVIAEDDVVIDSNVLSSVTTAGSTVLINRQQPITLMTNRSIDATNGKLTGSFDTDLWYINDASSFFPFVQQVGSNTYAVSFIATSSGLLLKGFFTSSSLTVNYWYTTSENTAVSFYNLATGTTLNYAGTKPFDLSTDSWGDAEVETTQFGYTTTASTITFASTTCAALGTNCYVFLQARNLKDQFGSVGWVINPSDPTTPTFITVSGPTPPNSNSTGSTNPFNIRFTYSLKASTTAFTITLRKPAAYTSVVSGVSITAIFSGGPALRSRNTLFRNVCTYSNSGVLQCTTGTLMTNGNVIRFKVTGRITSPPSITASFGGVTRTVSATAR